MLCMLLWWLQNEAPSGISVVSVVFPVTGHSFLPPDRVFGRIEKDVRILQEILNQQSYRMIFFKLRHCLRAWKTLGRVRLENLLFCSDEVDVQLAIQNN